MSISVNLLQKSLAISAAAVVLLPLVGIAQVAVLRERACGKNCRVITTQLSDPIGPEVGWVKVLVQEQWIVTTGKGINGEIEESVTQKEPYWFHASCSDGTYGMSKSGRLADATIGLPPRLLGEPSKDDLYERHQILCRAFGLHIE